MITNKNYYIALAKLSDKKLMYDFAKEMFFDEKALGNKSTRERSLIRLLESPGIMVSASGVSSSHKKSFPKTRFLSYDPNDLCDNLKLIIQEKQAGNNSDIIDEEIVAIVDKLLEYECISKKQHKILLLKCSN